MTWRAAKSLVKLRDQINAAYPSRDKSSDGMIGDVTHQSQGSASDHNPNSDGVVTAIDITHDPANGVDIDKLSDILVASRDPRIKYIIANGLIAGPGSNWQWQQSSGHYSHIHISVNAKSYDDESKWNIGETKVMINSYEDVVQLFLATLHVTPDINEAQPWIGMDYKKALGNILKSQQYLEQNHTLIVAHPEAIKEINHLKRTTPGGSTEAESKLKAIRDIIGNK